MASVAFTCDVYERVNLLSTDDPFLHFAWIGLLLLFCHGGCTDILFLVLVVVLISVFFPFQPQMSSCCGQWKNSDGST